MSKSLSRVTAALTAAGLSPEIRATTEPTRTAEQAAAAAGVALDQIVKSILFQGASGGLFLFLTAGGNQVDAAKATDLASEALHRAEADIIRRVTGFAIGGVSPLGHLTPLPIWMDPRLTEFPEVWAAAGTPNHIFCVTPDQLLALTGARLADFTL
jgi:prolyl-tRNA editing enzyme YbaK/EbsC (Cys-tRNA(Pro) deacylase)